MPCLAWRQRLMFISMLGRFSQFLMRLLSVGHLFLVNVVYATAVLINALACLWCAIGLCGTSACFQTWLESGRHA